MINKIYTFKTTNGDTLLGDLHSIDEKLAVLNITFPVKLALVPTQTATGLITQYFPTLYQPFGITNVVPFKSSFFTSIVPCSEFDERYYMNILEMLLTAETQRLLVTERFFNEQDYPDVYIMKAPEAMQ